MDGTAARQYVKDHLSQRAILLQLSEEASELSVAATKLVRILDGENPSPVSPEEARSHILEEYGDVLDCIDILITPEENAVAMDGRMKRFVRWAGRIRERLERKK